MSLRLSEGFIGREVAVRRPSEVLPDVVGLVVACDTETSGLYVDDGARCSIVSVAYWPPGEEHRLDNTVGWAFPFDQGAVDKPGTQASLFDGDEGINLEPGEFVWLMEWLSRQHLVFHKAYFDLQILAKGLRGREAETGRNLSEQVLYDTKIGAWVLDPTQPTGLKATSVRRRLGGGDEDGEMEAMKPWLVKTKKRFDLVPWEVVAPYATADAVLTLLLARAQWAELEEGASSQDDARRHIEFELKISDLLTKMAFRGVGFDLEAAKRSREVLEEQRAQLLAGLPFKPATPAGARRWFYEHCQALPHCVTNGGVASVGECCVRALQAQGVPGAKEWAALSKVTHAIEKYYVGYAGRVGADERLRTDYVQAGTVTMRFASHRVNLQAIPHDYQLSGLDERAVRPKQLFVPRGGWRLFEFDFAQAELRIAAKKAGCDRMLELITSGADVHADTADQLFGGHGKQERNIAKRANFSLIYMVGAKTFRDTLEKFTGIDMPIKESEGIVRKWRELYPEFPRVNRKAEAAAQRYKKLNLVDGRQYVFRPFDEERKAFNAWVQGSLAQAVKAWMVAIDKPGEIEVLLQVHDSVVVEIVWDEAGADGERRREWVALTGGELATEMFGVPMVADSAPWGRP